MHSQVTARRFQLWVNSRPWVELVAGVFRATSAGLFIQLIRVPGRALWQSKLLLGGTKVYEIGGF